MLWINRPYASREVTLYVVDDDGNRVASVVIRAECDSVSAEVKYTLERRD